MLRISDSDQNSTIFQTIQKNEGECSFNFELVTTVQLG